MKLLFILYMSVVINFKPSVRQTEAWQYLTDRTTTEVLYGGGAGGGKTYLGCAWQTHNRLKHPLTRGLIGRKTLKSIKESTLITFFEVFRDWGLKLGEHVTYVKDEGFKFFNGSEIVFKELSYDPSDPDYNKLGSAPFTDAFLEEAHEISQKAFEIVNSRIRWMLDVYDLKPKVLLTCNPQDTWIKSKYIVPYRVNALQPYQKYVQALVTDNPNPAFVKLYKEQLEKLTNQYDKDRLLSGDWDAQPKTGGEFYKDFIPDVHTGTCKEEYNDALPLHISFDFNKHPYMTCTIWQVQEFEGVYLCYQLAEITPGHPRNSTKDVCTLFKQMYPRHDAGLIVYGDPSGLREDTRSEQGHNDYSVINLELQAYHPSLKLHKAQPPVKSRGDFMNAIFRSEIDSIQVLIDTACKNTISDYTYLQEDRDGTKLKKKVKSESGIAYEKYGHTSDANDYFLTYIFKDQFDLFRGGKRGIIATKSF